MSTFATCRACGAPHLLVTMPHGSVALVSPVGARWAAADPLRYCVRSLVGADGTWECLGCDTVNGEEE